MAEEYKVLVQAELDPSSISRLKSTLQSELNNLTSNTFRFRVDIDATRVQSQIDNIRRQLQSLSGIRINLWQGGSGSGGSGGYRGGSNTINDYKMLLNLINEINSKRIQLQGLDKVSGDTRQIQTLRTQIQELVTQYTSLRNVINGNLSFDQLRNIQYLFEQATRNLNVLQSEMADTSAVQRQEQAYKKLLSVEKEIGNLEIKLGTLRNAGGSTNQINEITSQLQTLRQTYNDLMSQMNMPLTNNQLDGLNVVIVDTENKLRELEAKFADAKSKLAEGIFGNVDNSTFANQMSKVVEDFSKLKTASADTKASFAELELTYKELIIASEQYKNNASPENIQRLINANEKYVASLKKTKNQIDINSRAEASQVSQLDKSLFSSQIDAWSKKNSAALKVFGAQIDDIKRRLQTADKTEMGNLRKEFQIIQNEAKAAGLAVQSFGDRFKQSFHRLTSYFSGMTLIMKSIQAIRSMYNEVKEVDKAMTELYRVTDLSDAQYTQLYENMTASAKTYKTELSDMINSTASWVRLGFDENIANRMAEITAMYQHVTDLDEFTAVNNLITAYKGFEKQLLAVNNGDSVAAMEQIADIYDLLGNRFAESAADVGEGLSKAASVLALGGADIEQAAGMFTGIQETIQDASVSGAALKILTLRIRGMKGELQELGEEVDENVDSISKVQTQILNLTHGKVNIFDDAGNFRNIYDIMRDISEIYNDLSDPERASLLEILAGKNRANAVQAMLDNWENVERATEAAYNSAGTAQEEQAKWAESLEGHLADLKTAWQTFANDFLGSDFLKKGTDTLRDLVNILDNVIKRFSTLGTISAGIAIKNVFSYFTSAYTTHFNAAVEKGVTGMKAFGSAVKGAGQSMKSFLASGNGIITIISAIITIVSLVSQAVEQAKQARIEAWNASVTKGTEAIEDANNIAKLYKSYEIARDSYDGTAESKDNLKKATEDLLTALGYEQTEIQNLTDDYSLLDETIQTTTKDILEKKLLEVKEGLIASKNLLKESVGENSTLGTMSISWRDSDQELSTQVYNTLKQAGQLEGVVSDIYTNYRALLFDVSDDEGIVGIYDRLTSMRDTLLASDIGIDQLSQSSLYNNIVAMITKIEESYGGYIDYIKEYASLVAQLNVDSLIGNIGEIDSPEKFKELRTALINTVNANGEFVGSEEDVANAVDAVLYSIDGMSVYMSDYEQNVLHITRTTQEAGNVIEETAEKAESAISSFGRSLSTLSTVNKNGAVNLLLRPEVDTSLLKEAGYDVKDGDLSNVFAETFSNEDNTVAINLSPVILDEYGNVKSVLSKKNLRKYANEILEGGDDYLKLQVGATFEGDDALNNAKYKLAEIQSAAKNFYLNFNSDGKYDELIEGLSAISGMSSAATEELEKLNKALEGGDYDDGMESRVKYYEQMVDLLKEGKVGSKEYKSIAEYFGIGDLDVEEQIEWLKLYSAWFSDAEEGTFNFLDYIQSVNDEMGELISYDVSTGKFWFDPNELDTIAKKLGITKGTLIDLINSVRSYSPDWDMFDDAELNQWFTNSGLIKQSGDALIVYTDKIRALASALGFTDEEIDEMISRVSNLDEYADNKKIEIGFEYDGSETAQQVIDDVNKLKDSMDLSNIDMEEQINAIVDVLSETTPEIAAEVIPTIPEDYRQDVIDKLAEQGIDISIGAETDPSADETISGMKSDVEYLDNDGNAHKVTIEVEVDGKEDVEDLTDLLQNEIGEDGIVTASQDESNPNKVHFEIEYSSNAEDIKTENDELVTYVNDNIGTVDEITYTSNIGTITTDFTTGITTITSSVGTDNPITITVDSDSIQTAIDLINGTGEEDGLVSLLVDLGDGEPITITLTHDDLTDSDNALKSIKEQIEGSDQWKSLDVDAETASETLNGIATSVANIVADITNPDGYILNIDGDATNLGNTVDQAIEENEKKEVVIKVKSDWSDWNTPENAEANSNFDTFGTPENNSGFDIDPNTVGQQDYPVDATLNNSEELTGEIETAIDSADTSIEIPELPDLGNATNIPVVSDFKINEIDTTQQQQALSDFQDSATNAEGSVDNLNESTSNLAKTDVNSSNKVGSLNVITSASDRTASSVNNARGNVQNFSGTPINVANKTSPLSNLMSSFSTIVNSAQRAISAIKDFNNTPVQTKTLSVNTTTYTSKVTKPSNASTMATGTKSAKNGLALLGDEYSPNGSPRPELVVSNGHAYVAGLNGMQFANLQRGDIVYPYSETKKILANSKEYAKGAFPAFAGGTVYRPHSQSTGAYDNYGNYNSYDTISAAQEAESAVEEASTNIVDWIEVAIDRIERTISNFRTVAESTYKSLGVRAKATANEIAKIEEEISIQQQGYNRYLQEANKSGLSRNLAQKVMNGAIDITEYDEATQELISDFQTWYEKALDCNDAILQLKETLASLYESNFNNVKTFYDNVISDVQHEQMMLEEFITQTEAKGYFVSGEYYKALYKNQNEQIKDLQKEKTKLLTELQTGLASGTIEQGSESWYSMVLAINEVTQAIEQGNTQLIEYQNNIRQIKWDAFDFLQAQISQITNEADFLIDLMSNKKLYNERGQLTSEGQATMGLHAVDYDVYMNQADKYAKEIKKIDADLANDPYNKDLIERRQTLLELQQESILSAEQEKNAIKEMVEEGINLELQSLQDLIDSYEDSLDKQKDLYDYQKKVKEQTKEIASLEKQLTAYQNDTSEEARMKIQKIKVSLEEAKEDLRETEYEKFISDQKELLSDLYDEYESILNQRLDNVDSLLADMIEETNKNASTISTTIEEQVGAVGYTLTSEMQSIWSEGGVARGVVATYSKDYSTTLTSINTTINGISVMVSSMLTASDTKAQDQATELKTKDSSTTSASNTTQGTTKKAETTTKKTTTTTTKTDNQTQSSALTNEVAMHVAAAIWNGNYGWGNYPERKTKLNEVWSNGWDVIQAIVDKGYWYSANYSPVGYSYAEMRKKFKGYASGIKDIKYKQLAFTQEGRNEEYIIRPSDGAILTPLAKGDSVLNAQASGNLWDMSNNPTEFIKDNLGIGSGTSITGGKISNDTYNNDIELSINLPNVMNYEQFKYAMQHDSNFERMIQAMTVGRMMGKSGMKKYQY